MTCYLGLGSNLGDRKQYLEQALNAIRALCSHRELRISPVYETPALLPEKAPPEWNKPFYNLVVRAEMNLAPLDLLAALQAIEAQLGRNPGRPRWSPREIDIDILLIGEQVIESDKLKIPHPGLSARSFVLDPLKDLAPSLRISGSQLTVLDLARELRGHGPLWMGIINATPDSFSDGGQMELEQAMLQRLHVWESVPVGIVDIGAESTRPNAVPVSPIEEWRRLLPKLEIFQDFFCERNIRPLLSVDSRHYVTLEKAIEYSCDIINDVAGLADDRMLDLVKGSNRQYVLMHSLTIPASPRSNLADDVNVLKELSEWFSKKLDHVLSRGLNLDQVILDPGIGFGKNRLQNMILLQELPCLRKLGCRIMVGHSRKSFMNDFTLGEGKENEIESVGASLALIESGCDILRVHDPIIHHRAYLGFTHSRNRGLQ